MRVKYKQRQLFIKWFSIAWHWNWSLTWRWIFDIKRHDPCVLLGFHKMRIHQGSDWLIVWNTRLLDFAFRSQPNMPRLTMRAPDPPSALPNVHVSEDGQVSVIWRGDNSAGR